MDIHLSDHFDYKKLLRFTFPSIVGMVFTSVYSVIDGYFISNYAGKIPFAAINFIYPLIQMLSCIGFVFGTGGNALISKIMGEGHHEKANSLFSLFVYTSSAIALVISVIGFLFLRPIAVFMGGSGEMLEYAIIYGRILFAGLTTFVLQVEFQSFFIAAGKPKLGLYITLAAGITNIIGDFLFVGVLRLGIVGAATATVSAQVVGSIIPLFYFTRKNDSLLHLQGTQFDGPSIFKALTNGASELMSNISASLIAMLYNSQLLKFYGDDGVAAYGTIMYVSFIFIAIYFGYSSGTAPLISYHYGAQNREELKNLYHKSLVITLIMSLMMFTLSHLLAPFIVNFYVSYDQALHDLTLMAFRRYAFSYLFAGFSIFGSAFFTALNNGLISAIISFSRTLFYQSIAVMVLPMIFGVDAIWFATLVSGIFSSLTTFFFIRKYRSVYQY